MKLKIIIDSNIIFSAILNVDSKISQIILNGYDYFDFYTPEYAKLEVLEHKEKIKTLARLNENEFIELFHLIFSKTTTLSHSLIDKSIYNKAYSICKEIDEDDTPFVAFSLFLDAILWTGDKKLIKGLISKDFKNTITTEALFSKLLMELNPK